MEADVEEPIEPAGAKGNQSVERSEAVTTKPFGKDPVGVVVKKPGGGGNALGKL